MHKKSRSLYFSERIIKAVNRVFEYPLTIVEAPMGYGKTTAIKELLGKTDANILWLKVFDGSIRSFWEAFARLFSGIDSELSQNLLQLGIPTDGTTMMKVVSMLDEDTLAPVQAKAKAAVAVAATATATAIATMVETVAVAKIATTAETVATTVDTASASTSTSTTTVPVPRIVIVIDDYHLVSRPELDKFFELLAMNEMEHLHIVLTARYIELPSQQELVLKGFGQHVTKEYFELAPREIVAYYKQCGIALKDTYADRLYSYTEGWISALYLMMLNFKKEHRLETPGDIYKLVEKAVYQPFSEEIREFLLHICIFESISLEQAAHVWKKDNTARLLAEIINKNAFIKFDTHTKTYQIHNIFSGFLRDELEKTGMDYKKQVWREAADWHMTAGGYLDAMHYFYLLEDYDQLLCALEKDKGHSIYNEHKEVFIRYYERFPMEIKRKHPAAILIYGLCLFSFNEFELFEDVCGDFGLAMQENIDLDPETANRLMGEFELLLSFTGYNDIEKMYFHIKNAYELLGNNTAEFIDTRGSWTFGAPSVLYMFYREPGQLACEVNSMKQAMPLYGRLTNGHGTGAEFIMEAEQHFNRGNFQEAEILSHKALQLSTSRGQWDILLCAIFLQARIALCHGNYTQVLSLQEKLEHELLDKRMYNLLHTVELCQAFLYGMLNQTDRISQWICNADLASSNLYFPTMAFLNIVYGRVLLINGEYLKLLGIAEELIGTASVFPNILGQIYSYIYIGAANERVLRREDALTALKQALELAVADRVYVPFVENCDFIRPLLEELQRQGCHHYRAELACIFRLHDKYRAAVEKITREHFSETRPALSQREMEIAQLAASGMTNKEIGEALFISPNTVKMALKSIYSKLSVNSRPLLAQQLKFE